MGYSASSKAFEVLERITEKYRYKDSGNTININGVLGFYEVGRENNDGAITGSFRFLSSDMKTIIKSVSFRIGPSGKIERFPLLAKSEKWNIYQQAMGQYQKKHKISFMVI